MIHFYTHIVEINILHKTLDEIEMEEHERKELIMIAEAGIHHVVIDTVLSELSEEDKKKFLTHLAEDNHDTIWAYLKEKTDDIEEKISTAAKKFLNKLNKDVRKMV